jgi:hypothetical protein
VAVLARLTLGLVAAAQVVIGQEIRHPQRKPILLPLALVVFIKSRVLLRATAITAPCSVSLLLEAEAFLGRRAKMGDLERVAII